eukprot:4718896-Pyramimonas_sp.AAC.1
MYPILAPPESQDHLPSLETTADTADIPPLKDARRHAAGAAAAAATSSFSFFLCPDRTPGRHNPKGGAQGA